MEVERIAFRGRDAVRREDKAVLTYVDVDRLGKCNGEEERQSGEEDD